MTAKMTPREKRILEVVKTHLPAERIGRKARTGSPTCGLLDILDILKKELPYKLTDGTGRT